MEKIKINNIKHWLLFFTCYASLFLIFNISKDLKDLTIIISMSLLVLIPIEISNFFNKDGLYLSQAGIIHKYLKKDHLIKWEDVKIETKIKYGYIYLINIEMSHLKRGHYRLIIFWPTENDILEKTKKYCPQDHELYKLVEEYAKKRSLPF